MSKQQQLPTELRGVLAPKLKSKGAQNWPADGACILYTKGFEAYKFCDTPDGIDDMVMDTLIDISINAHRPMTGGEKVKASRRGVRFAAASTRHAAGTIHVVIGIDWTDGQWSITYRNEYDGPPPK